jgi:hypothetical protein
VGKSFDAFPSHSLNVSLSLLKESKTNPRRIFEDAALKELGESIRTPGRSVPIAGKTAHGDWLRNHRRGAKVSRRTDG